jgi:tape measure domain-containing protein
MAGSTIRAQIKLDGGKAFADDFKKAASAVSAANSELKYLDSELKKNGQSTEALSKKTEAVNKAWKAEQETIDQLTSRIEELNSMTGVDTTEAVNRLTEELYKHKQAQNELGESVEQTGEDFGSLANDIAVAQTVLNVAKDVIVEIAKKIWDVGKGAVQYNAQLEGYQRTIEAFFKTSGMSAEEAVKSTADLIANQKELSSQIGIGTDKLIEANKALIAADISGEKSQQAVEGLAKAIVATGGGNEELARMATNLQQIANNGKAAEVDLKQFSNAGINIKSLVADNLGITNDELSEMDITFDMIVDALTEATSEGGKFFEASQAGASTLNGQMNTLKTTVQEGLGTAFEPVNQALTETLLPTAQKIVDEIDWAKVGEGVATAVENLSELLVKVQEVVNWLEQQRMEEKGSNFVEDFANGVHSGNGLMAVAAAHLTEAMNAELIEERSQATLEGKEITDSLASGMASGKSGVIGEAEEIQKSAFTVWAENAQAEQYGADFVAGFANGMHRNNGLIATAAATIAETIKEFLHFSRPDVGPLRDYEQWMPDFVAGLAKGIEDSEWMLADASADLAQTITNNTVTNNVTMSVYGTAGQSAADIADIVMLRIQQATDRRTAVWA